jgi:predicted acylesterase/phospholipase RssA
METPILPAPVKALVLSSGGMFGAYQAGAWEVLSETFKPDIVVGASIGSLNGWAVAGGCDPQELSRRWLELHDVSRNWTLPSFTRGFAICTTPTRLRRGTAWS